MEFGFYERQLLVLASFCVVFLGIERNVARGSTVAKESTDNRRQNGSQVSVRSELTRKYLLVYAIVMGARPIHNLNVFAKLIHSFL